jgi:hypothetical protein
MLDNEQRNKNILKRFESKEVGSKMCKYRVHLDDRSLTMIDMNGMSMQKAEQVAKNKFKQRFVEIYAC